MRRSGSRSPNLGNDEEPSGFRTWLREYDDETGTAIYGLTSTPLWLLLGIFLLNRHTWGWKALGVIIFLLSALFVLQSICVITWSLLLWRKVCNSPRTKLVLYSVPFVLLTIFDVFLGVSLIKNLQYPTYFSPLPSNPTSIVALPSTTTTTTTYVPPKVSYSIGPTAQCADGTFSYSANHRGTCSWHGGVSIWYK